MLSSSDRALLFFGSRQTLAEFAIQLKALGVPHECDSLRLHGAPDTLLPILTAAMGSASTLLVQAMLSFLERKKGQRRVIVQTTEADGTIRRIEIEAPNTAELLQLLSKAREVHLEERKAPAES